MSVTRTSPSLSASIVPPTCKKHNNYTVYCVDVAEISKGKVVIRRLACCEVCLTEIAVFVDNEGHLCKNTARVTTEYESTIKDIAEHRGEYTLSTSGESSKAKRFKNWLTGQW